MAGEKNEQMSDADEKLSKLCDVMDSLGAKLDSFADAQKRMDARMDAIEEERKDRKDSRKDAGFEREEGEDEEPKADRRKDAEEGEMEEEGEPTPPVADKRKDSRRDEDEEEEPKADRRKDSRRDEDEEERRDAHADAIYSQMADMRAEIARLQASTPALLSDGDRVRFAAIQEQADPVFQAFGDRAPGPLDGETPLQYKRRLGSKMQGHSPKWKEARLSAIADEASLDVVINDVYADSLQAANRGVDVGPGQLREISRPDGRGHIINTFVGEPEAWMRGFTQVSQRAGRKAH